MVISIDDKDNFKEILIPDSIDESSDKLNSCFAAFKRIKQINVQDDESDIFISKMQIVSKASIWINLLHI